MKWINTLIFLVILTPVYAQKKIISVSFGRNFTSIGTVSSTSKSYDYRILPSSISRLTERDIVWEHRSKVKSGLSLELGLLIPLKNQTYFKTGIGWEKSSFEVTSNIVSNEINEEVQNVEVNILSDFFGPIRNVAPYDIECGSGSGFLLYTFQDIKEKRSYLNNHITIPFGIETSIKNEKFKFYGGGFISHPMKRKITIHCNSRVTNNPHNVIYRYEEDKVNREESIITRDGLNRLILGGQFSFAYRIADGFHIEWKVRYGFNSLYKTSNKNEIDRITGQGLKSNLNVFIIGVRYDFI